MKYTIKWCEITKNGNTNGREWQMTKMTLVDEAGKETDEVTTFDTVINGGTIEGEIVQKGQYLNFVTAKPESGRKPNMDRVMEKKATMIGEAQTAKAQHIAEAQDRSAWMWAKNNASTLLASRGISPITPIDGIADMVTDLATKIYNAEPTTPF